MAEAASNAPAGKDKKDKVIITAGKKSQELVAQETLASMSKLQKLAALLVVLGQEIAAQILNEFDEREVESISTEMTKITFVSIPLQHLLLKEFSSVTMQAVTSAVGGPQYARDVLEKSLGGFKANELISRIAPMRSRTIDTSVLREIQPRQLVNLLRKEQIQTWAMVLSYLEPARCAEVLALVSADLRTDIVERIATMEPAPSEVVQQVLTHLKNRISARSQMDVISSGGTKILAEILNTLDDSTSKQVLTGLEERNPELSRSVKKLLFVFEDIGDLDRTAIARLLREVDFHVLAVALKTASDKLKATILGALSKRAAETISEEIQFMPPVKLSEVEAAQEQVIEVLRNLEASGEITLNRKGERNDVVV
jgi:flagellar motor switch protein FliG